MDIDLKTLSLGPIFAHGVPLRASGRNPKLTGRAIKIDDRSRYRVENNLRDALTRQHLRLIPTNTEDIGAYQVIHSMLHSGQINHKEGSQWLATHLYNVQPGSSSNGMLLVAKATCSGANAIAIIKVDSKSEIGSSEVGEQDDSSYAIGEITTLGMGHKVVKAAFFVATKDSLDNPILEIIAADYQAHGSEGRSVADFFLINFLECAKQDNPAVTMRHVADILMASINDHIEDAQEKSVAMQGVMSSFDSNNPVYEIDTVIQDYFPSGVHDIVNSNLQKAGVTAVDIEKDTSNLDGAKYLSCTLSNGLRIVGLRDQLFDMLVQETNDGLSRIRLEGTITEYKLRKNRG